MSSDATESQGRSSDSSPDSLHSKPNIKDLQSYKIISAIGPKWHELGIALLDNDQLRQLKVIETNNNEVTRRCTEMLMYWLESHCTATWYDLVKALKDPGVELNNVATTVEFILQTQSENVTVQPDHQGIPGGDGKQVELSESQNVQAHTDARSNIMISFAEFDTVSEAFVFLTSQLKSLLARTDFSDIKRSCIEQIKTPSGAQLPTDLVSRVKSCKNVTMLFEVLADSAYWSWIDVRLLKAMAAASGLVEAIQLLSSYKKEIFSKKLIDVIPNAPNKEIKEKYYTMIVTKLNHNSKEMTVADLLKFQSQMEAVIFDINKGICTLEHLEKGCVEVYWYIPTKYVSRAYHSAILRSDHFNDLCLQYLRIGGYPVIHNPLVSPNVVNPIPSHPHTVATVKDFVNYYYDYLSVNMDAEVVSQLMVSQQLLSEDIVKYAISDFQKNSLIIQQVGLMNEQTLFSFGQLLLTNEGQKHIGTMLIDGLKVSLLGSNSTISSAVDEVDIAAEQIEHKDKEVLPADKGIIHPSLVFGEFLNLKVRLEELVEQCDPTPTVEKCSSLLASDSHNIPLFPIGYTEELQDIKHTSELIQKLSPFTTWDNHSILSSIAEASDIPEATALLTQFDDKIDSSQLLTDFPIPAPSHHMVPYNNSTHTVLAVKLDSEMCHTTLQNVIDARLLIQDQCKLTSHCLQLLAVAKTNSTIIYWIIPKGIAHLITGNALQFQNYFYHKGILQLAVYPGAVLCTGCALKVGPLSFFNDSKLQAINSEDFIIDIQLSQIEELPQMISKMHKKMSVAINTITKMTKQKGKARMQWDVQSQHENLIIQSKELEADAAVQEKIIEKKKKYSELLGSDSMQEDDNLESQLQGGSKKLKLEAQFQSVQEIKLHDSQLNSELSEMNSKLMVKEKELAKLKEDNKRLIKHISDAKSRRSETIAQVSRKYEDKYINADMETLGCEEFESWLDVHDFSSEVCQAFKDAQIDGTLFLKLNTQQLKSIVSKEEDVLKLQELQLKVKISQDLHEKQHKSKVVQRSFKEYVEIRTLDSDDFSEWLQQQNIVEPDIVKKFKDEKVDGPCFLKLTGDNLKSFALTLQIRIKVQDLQKQVSKKYKDKYTNADIETLGCDEFESWLDVHNFSSAVYQAFKDAEIDGTTFLKLNTDQLKSIVSKEEDVLKLQELQLQVKSPQSALSVELENHKLSPTKWLNHFNDMHISQPEDLKSHKGSFKTYKALLHHCTTSEEKLSIQHLLSIPDEKLHGENPVPERKKKEFIEFLQMLGLTQQFPKKLKVKDAMLLRKETLDENKYTDQIEVLPYLIIQKIFMFDGRSRAPLFKPTKYNNSIKKIHPLDSFLALLHCCDNFLCQELLLKLSVCQMAIPILLPNPHDGSVMFLLWAMRSIIKSWKSNNKGVIESKECRIIEYPAPVISFIKLGNPNKNITKSIIINEVISESKEEFFLNWNSEGGSTKRLFVDGLCEICCYLPSGKNNVDFYSDMLLFLNIHGDAQNHVKQTQFIRKISYIIFVLVNEDDINENSLKLLAKLSKIPGGVVLMFADLENDQAFKSKETEQFISSMSIIKLVGKNNDEIRTEIRDNMLTKLRLPAVEHCKRLIECIDIAHKLQISVDEDDKECMEGKDLAQNLIKKVKSVDITKAKTEMLPLQSPSFWHMWAKFDKESFRHFSGKEDNDMKSYSKQMEIKKEAVRNSQCQLSQDSTLIMKAFLSSISKYKGNIRLYFLQWLRMFLDDYSREKLPDLSAAYHKARENLKRAIEANKDSQNESEKVKELRKQLLDQNDKLINASFGLEHLFREMGQIYEARMDPQVKVSQHLKNEVKSYPQIIIELMEEGYPVELMDGDASHVPKSWILAVIDRLKDKYVLSSKIFVISVLGIQSTGKSTLLNTVFGLHFNVSAGRCTRGAYFQLLTLNDTLRVKSKFHHILIVDTEGLRAPELQYKESQRHDNELATFVIGVADLTIINIYGETPGDLSDILETAVHAFIRMKQVDMQLSCHFVHQNVPAIMAEKKGKFGRQQFQDKLDFMTKTAAEGEQMVGCKFFRDVIQFNSDTDIMYFPSLWKGDPPMAPVNQGYSDKAFSLKQALITLAEKKQEHCTFDKFQMRVNKLWEAVLREKFVFSFKNTLEVIAYNELDTQYSQWSWTFKHKMLKWQNESTNIINSCEPSKLTETIESSLKKATDDLNTIYLEINNKIKTFFETSDKADTLAQWRKRTETRLETLLQEHKEAAKKHCEVLKHSREGRVQVDEIQKNYRQKLHKCITEITLNAKREHHTPQQRKNVFDTQWNIWLTDLTKFEKVELYASEGYIYATITKILENIFQAHGHHIIEKLNSKPLSHRGRLQLAIKKSSHLTSKAWRKRMVTAVVTTVTFQPDRNVPVNEEDVRDANFKTEDLLNGARDKIEDAVCTLQDYDPNVVDQIIYNLVGTIDEQNKIHASYKFTVEYCVDISIAVAGYAAKEMIKMVDKLRIQNSPVEALNKLKPIFFRTFESKFSAASNDKTAADNLSQLLATSIQTALIKVLRIEIINSMKVKSHFQKKNYFKVQVLEDLAQKNDFDLFSTFLTDVSSSFKYWAKYYVEYYCKEKKINNETNLTYLAKLQLGTIISNLTDAVSELETKYVDTVENSDDVNTNAGVPPSDSSISGDHDDGNDDNQDHDDIDEEGGVCINTWLEEFLQKIRETITIDLQEVQQMIGIKKLKDIKLFTKRFITNLHKVQENLIQETEKENSKLSKVSDWDQPPHLLLSSTLTGCKESCPFCKEQCEYTDENHEDGKCHFTNIHRPECLGKMTWAGSGKLSLDICTESIESDSRFRTPETKGEYIPYKKYKDIYKKWVISNEKPKDGQTYWQWFCAKYNSEIVKWVGATPTIVDSGWKKITKEDAIHSLTLTYGSKVDT